MRCLHSVKRLNAGALMGAIGSSRVQKDGTICTFNVHEFALMVFVPGGGCAPHLARLARYSCLERCKDASMAGAKGDFQRVDQEPSGG